MLKSYKGVDSRSEHLNPLERMRPSLMTLRMRALVVSLLFGSATLGMLPPAYSQDDHLDLEEQVPLQLSRPVRLVELDVTSTPAFLKRFADLLESRLRGRSVGYAIAVRHANGVSQARAGGAARRAPDAMPRLMTATDRLNVASVSKAITASALLRALLDRKVSVDAPVYPYLPSDWTLGANVKSITFRELLGHRSGIRCAGGASFAALRQCLQAGVKLTDKNSSSYNNTNYSLLYVIIPKLANLPLPVPSEIAAPLYSPLYIGYVRSKVFSPAGMGASIDCKPLPSLAFPALAYQYPLPIIAGESFGDWTTRCGSAGWNLSAAQLATFTNALLFTNSILPASVRAQVMQGGLGLRVTQLAPGLASYSKGGFFPGKRSDGSLWNKGELHSLIVGFSNQVSVGIIVNSQLSAGPDLLTAAVGAMQEALE